MVFSRAIGGRPDQRPSSNARARGGDGAVDVLVRGVDDVGDDLAARWVLDVDHRVVRAVDPFAVDEQLRLAGKEVLGPLRVLALRAVDGGDFVHVIRLLLPKRIPVWCEL